MKNELPADIPYRDLLLEAGLSLEQIRQAAKKGFAPCDIDLDTNALYIALGSRPSRIGELAGWFLIQDFQAAFEPLVDSAYRAVEILREPVAEILEALERADDEAIDA